jgi:hypothetical protein
VKIDVTFSGLDPSRLAERIDQRLRERRATRATTVASLRSSDDAGPPPVQQPRPANRRPRRDRRS